MESFAFCQQCGVNQPAVADCGHEHDHQVLCSTCGVTLDVSPLDVFISYSREDAAFARRLSAKLGGAGIPHWMDERNLGPGDDFTRGVSAALDQAKLLVVLLTPESVTSPWVRDELVQAKNAHVRLLGIRLKRFPLPQNFTLMFGSTLYADVFDRPDEVALEEICQYVHDNLCKIAAAGKRVVPVVEPAPDTVALLGVRRDVRYLGPVPYEREDSKLFVGRDNYGKSILDTLQDKNVALYSPSGAGKTSLIHAKIRTSLEEEGWEVWVGGEMRREPPPDLLGSISNRISFLVNYGLVRHEDPDPRRGIADQLRAMSRHRSSAKRVLILDQFEVIFTHHKDRDEDRKGFFADLLNALKCDPALRLLLAFRQEFLAGFLELIEGSEDLFTCVHLKRMDEKEACEAITRPVASYATFAPGVAEGIVKLLTTRPDRGRAELELVHLQIVCKELWRNLEEGITEIQQDHVDRAAGGRGTLKRFVEDVLQSFVHKAVEAVAAETGVAPELIHFGLLKFVNKSGGRVTLPMDFSRERTGRLSNNVVELLAAEHLLRAETRGGEHWYELSHDLLVEPVAQHRNPKLSKLLAVTDLLATVLDRAREECEAANRAREECEAAERAREECEPADRRHGEGAAPCDGKLTGYFGAHGDLLKECEGVYNYDPQLLDAEDEAELVFRASLACGSNMDLWSTRLGETSPYVRNRVLVDAVTGKSTSAVRGNAVRVLGNTLELGRELVPVALHDPDDGVRDRAAASLAVLNDPKLYTEVVDALGACESNPGSTRTLAAVLAEAENRGVTSHREPFSRLPRWSRRRIRTASRRLRLRRAAPSLVYVVLCAAILAGIGTGLFKGIPTAFNIGITQLTGSLFMGLYQGFVAGTSFGALISLSLAVHYAISARRTTVSYFRPVLPILLGIVSGALSGVVVDLIILGVYSGPTMTDMHWINNECVMDHRLELLEQVFFKSHYGWCFVISGAFLGCGVAMVSNRLRNWDHWLPALNQEEELTGLQQAASVIKRIARVALPHAWPIAVALTVAAPLAALPVSPVAYEPYRGSSASAASQVAESPRRRAPKPCSGSAAESRDGRRSDLVPWDVAADCGCQVTGGFALIIGMGFGIVLLRRGVHIQRRRRA